MTDQDMKPKVQLFSRAQDGELVDRAEELDLNETCGIVPVVGDIVLYGEGRSLVVRERILGARTMTPYVAIVVEERPMPETDDVLAAPEID